MLVQSATQFFTESWPFLYGKQFPLLTGFPALDSLLGGLTVGLHILAGTPQVGKTAFAAQIADQVAQQGRDVLFISFQRSKEAIFCLNLARRSAIPDKTKEFSPYSLGPGKQWTDEAQKVMNEYSKTEAAKHLFVAKINQNFAAVDTYELIAKFHADHKCFQPLVIFDSLDDIDLISKKWKKKEIPNENLDILQQTAKQLNIPILVTAPIPKVTNDINELPFEAHLKQSVMVLSNGDTAGENPSSATCRQMSIEILHNANGKPLGTVQYNFWPNLALFEEVP